jgi:hypothetical protein
MTQLTNEAILGQLTAVLHEEFEGSPHPWSYLLDPGPEAALLGMLAKVSAADASREVAGTSVAAQVYHVAFGLGASASWIRGERVKSDWAQSWAVGAVNEETWGRLQADLRARYAELREAINGHGTSDVEALGGAIGAIAHVAYHLGAIRQKLAVLRADTRPTPP